MSRARKVVPQLPMHSAGSVRKPASRRSEEEVEGSRESCHCHTCRQACRYSPGWFLPGEVEHLAESLEVSVQELFDESLCVDWWVGDDDMPTTFVLSPAIKSSPAGTEKSANPRGECVFYDEEVGCTVHETGHKPYECSAYLHGEEFEDVHDRHKRVAEAWNTPEHQQMIADLLDREPMSSPFFGGLLGGILGY